MREMLLTIADLTFADDTDDRTEYGEVWANWSTRMPGFLGMRNFDRIADALIKRGLIAQDEGVGLTPAGRALAEQFTKEGAK